MNLAKLRGLADSPSFLRGARDMLAAWRLALDFLVLNAAFGVMILGALYLFSSGPAATIAAEMGLGRLLACAILLTGTGLVTLLAPCTAAGLFDLPRWGRYFEQIILSGISPARYAAGVMLHLNLLLLLLGVAALPYLVFAGSLGGTDPAFLAQGALAICLYANALALLTLALGVHVYEGAAALAVFFAACLAHAVVLTEGRGVLDPLTPFGFCIEPFCRAADAAGFRITRYGWAGSTPMTSWIVPGSLAFTVGGSLLIAMASLWTFLLGPLGGIAGPTSTFGQVVFPGDRRRGSLFRFRPFLRRQAEIAFFYENRSAWIGRWEAVLRMGGWLLLLGIPASGGCALLQSFPGRGVEFWEVNALLFGVSLLAGALVFTSTRPQIGIPLRAGRRAFSSAQLDRAAWWSWVAFLAILFCAVPEFRLRRDPLFLLAHRNEVAPGLLILPILLLMGVQAIALGRGLMALWWRRHRAILALAFLLSTWWIMPMLLSEAFAQWESGVQWMRSLEAWVSMVSPLGMMRLQFDAGFYRGDSTLTDAGMKHLFLLGAGGNALATMLLLFWSARVIRRVEAERNAPEEVAG